MRKILAIQRRESRTLNLSLLGIWHTEGGEQGLGGVRTYLCSRRPRERSGVSGSWTPPRDWKWKGNETYNVADNVARTSTATSPAVAALVGYSISLNPVSPSVPLFAFPSFNPTVVKNHRLSAPFLVRAPFLTFSFLRSFVSACLPFLCPHFFALSTPFDNETMNASVMMRFVQKEFAKVVVRLNWFFELCVWLN